MKIFSSILTAAIAVASLTVNAQNLSFTVDVQSPKRPQTMSIKVMSNGTILRMEPPADGNVPLKILVDQSKNTQYMLTEKGTNKVAAQVDAFNPDNAGEKSATPKIEVTKEIRVIDGMNCTKVTAETDETSTTMWVTSDLSVNYSDLFRIVNTNRNAPGSRSALPATKNINGFPLEVLSKDKKTSEEVKINIRNVNTEKLDPALFSLDGYRLTDMRKIK